MQGFVLFSFPSHTLLWWYQEWSEIIFTIIFLSPSIIKLPMPQKTSLVELLWWSSGSVQGVQFRSLVGELISHTSLGQKTKAQKRKENRKQPCNKFKKEFNNYPHPKKKKKSWGKKKTSLVISWNFHVFLIILVSKFFQYQLDSYHFHAFLTQ